MASEIKAGVRVFVTALASDGLPHNALGTVVGRAGREWSVRLYGVAECICSDAEIHVLRFPDDIAKVAAWAVLEAQEQRDKARVKSAQDQHFGTLLLVELMERGIDADEFMDIATKRWTDVAVVEREQEPAQRARLRLV